MKNLFRKSGAGQNTWALFVAGLVMLWLLFLGRKSTSIKAVSPPELIRSMLTRAGYSERLANWWVAVSNFETGKWQSGLYRTAHNMFGMKQPKTRQTTSIGATSKGWASYESDSDSVEDLILYMQEFNYPQDFMDFDDFIAFMKLKGYFADAYGPYRDGVKSRL